MMDRQMKDLGHDTRSFCGEASGRTPRAEEGNLSAQCRRLAVWLEACASGRGPLDAGHGLL
jgi:hypothetical protein